MQDVVNLFSPSYDPQTGYGRMALELTWYLSQMGVHVNALGRDSLGWKDKLHPAMIELLSKPVKPTVGGIVMGYPNLIEKYGEMVTAGPFIVSTMFESTEFPASWKPYLAKAKAVIVPAQWLVKVVQKNSAARRIEVVPLGVSETFTFVDRASRYHHSGLYPGQHAAPEGEYHPRKDGKPFIFLCLGDRGMRKGWDIAAQAFHNVFGNDERYRLIIKAREGSFAYNITNPNVEIIGEDMDEHALQQLYADADCYVFPTRGEGFGLPPREAARTGLPAIATNWGGTADDLGAWGYPINYAMDQAWQGHPFLDGLGEWAEPDLQHLMKQMQYMVSRQRIHMWYEARPERQDHRVARAIRKLYKWDRFAMQTWDVWQKANAPTIKERRAQRKAKKQA